MSYSPLASVTGQYYGGLSTTSYLPSVMTLQNTYYKMQGVTTTTVLSGFTSSGVNNRLTYTGTQPILAQVTATIAMTATNSNEVYGFRIAKNDSALTASAVDRKIGTSTDVGAVAIVSLITLATNDYVEVWSQNESAAAHSIFAEHLHLVAIAAGPGS